MEFFFNSADGNSRVLRLYRDDKQGILMLKKMFTEFTVLSESDFLRNDK